MAHFGIALQLTRRTATCVGWHSCLSPGWSTSAWTLTTGIAGVTRSLQKVSCPVENHRPAAEATHIGHSCWHLLLPTRRCANTQERTETWQRFGRMTFSVTHQQSLELEKKKGTGLTASSAQKPSC